MGTRHKAEAEKATPPVTGDSPGSDPDLRTCGLQDLVDLAQLRKLMDSFGAAIGVASAIVDLDGNILVGSRWQRVCTHFHRACPISMERCRESDTVLSAQIQSSEGIATYRCRNGLIDSASPIVIEGRHIANAFVGQFFFEPPDLDFFRCQAAELGFDEADYLDAVGRVPIISPDRLPVLHGFLASLAQLVGTMGMQNARAAQAESEIRRQSAALAESREAHIAERDFADATVNSLPGFFAMYTPAGRIVRWNANLERVLGLSPDEVAALGPLDRIHPDDRGRVSRRIQDVMKAGYAQWEARLMTRDGGVTPYLFRGRRTTLAGKPYLIGIALSIEDRKRVEEALKASERRYRELVQTANSIILYWDNDGTIGFMNRFGLSFFGYSRDEILGRNVIGTIVPETDTSGRDLVAMIANIRRHPEEHRTNVNENMRKDGERVWVAWTNQPTFDTEGNVEGILSVGVDMTECKRAEEALQRSERKYRAIVETAQEGIWILDLAGKTTFTNRPLAKMLGYRVEELLGQPVKRFVAEDSWAILEKALSRSLRVNMGASEVHLRRKDGADLWAMVSMSSATDGTRSTGYFLMLMDITEHKRVEEHKRQFYRETLSSVTDGKLQIVGRDECERFVKASSLCIPIRTALDCTIARRDLAAFCRTVGYPEANQPAFTLAFGEAMTNAVKHGGGGEVFAGADENDVWIGVKDSGPGISALILPHATLQRGYSTKVSLGLGYSIILEVADKVMLATGPDGTSVVLIKSLRSSPADPNLPNPMELWTAQHPEGSAR